MTRWAICLGFAFFLCSGCIIIPTAEHGRDFPTRVRIEKKTLDLIVPGKTTRKEVLIQLGEPDVVMKKEQIFAYYWTLTAGYFIVGAGYGGGAAPIGRTHIVLVEFDDRGIVKRCETKGGNFLSLEKFSDW
jgi:hypothetical protein